MRRRKVANTHIMVDPPSGWKYGFPKRMPTGTEDVGQWLIDNNYPEDDVEFALAHCRMWMSKRDGGDSEGN